MRRYLPAFASSFLLHALLLGWLSWDPPHRLRPKPLARETVTAFLVPLEDSRFPGLKPTEDEAERLIDVDDVPANVTAGGFTFEVEKIAERADVLFPFLTPGLSIDHFALRSERTIRKSLENPFATAASRDRAADDAPPLNADEPTLQRLVDGSWSRRARWKGFDVVRRLTEAHSASAGRLPELLQRYCDQNSLQPYADTAIRDPRLWVQLGIVADHVDFIGFIRRYAAEHRSTKATTALLFLLDAMVQGSVDALKTLLETDPAVDLSWTRAADPRAHELLVRLRRYYQEELTRRGLKTVEGLTVFHESVRLSILTGIVDTTPNGYRASDARLLIGAIHWRRRQLTEALRWWRGMTIDPGDSHVRVSSQILDAVRNAPPTGDGDVDARLQREVTQVLKNERGHWVMFSRDRLRQFGYSVDTF